MPSSTDGFSNGWGVIGKVSRKLAPSKRQDTQAARPAGFQPGDSSPDLLTEDEAIRYLRLDTIALKNPHETLQRYRKAGRLKGTQVSKRVFYLRSELDAFLKAMTENKPR